MKTRHRLALTALVLVGAAARAGDDGRPRATAPVLPKYAQECASCHIAYPPGLLPAPSWRRLMADLPHHFGTDASLDAASFAEVARWLDANAGGTRRVARDGAAPPQDRITRSRWFVREHDEIPTATWQRASIRSPANCAACHTRADEGDFRERHIRIPR